MISVAIAAAAFIQAGFSEHDAHGRIEFTLVDPSSTMSVPFAQAEPRYALVRLDPAGEGAPQAMPLDQPDGFSRLQSTRVLAQPSGRYAVIDAAAADDVFAIRPGGAEALARFELGSRDWVSVTCAAHGPARCTARSREMLSAFQ